MRTRDEIVAAVKEALEPWALALWEGGAAAWGRVDEWSDIDLQAAVDDVRVEDAFAAVEAALPVDLAYRLPEPTWHGHAQAFFRIAGASPFHLLDFVVMKRSAERRYLEPERHGRARVHFDTIGFLEPGAAPAPDLGAVLDGLKTRFELFQVLTLKEVERGQDLEALAF